MFKIILEWNWNNETSGVFILAIDGFEILQQKGQFSPQNLLSINSQSSSDFVLSDPDYPKFN